MMDDKCKLCKNREEMCNDSMAMRNLCKRNGFDAFSPVTNADRIRAMSDEELAEFLWSIGSSPLNGNVYLNGKLIFFTGNGNGWLNWLKQEVESDG